MHSQGTPSLQELKLLYYRLYIRYHEHDNNYLEMCRCYRSIYETETVAADPGQWQPVRALLPAGTAAPVSQELTIAA